MRKIIENLKLNASIIIEDYNITKVGEDEFEFIDEEDEEKEKYTVNEKEMIDILLKYVNKEYITAMGEEYVEQSEKKQTGD